jgi:hypothetical protein
VGAIPIVFTNRGGIILYYAKHGIGRGTQFFAVTIFFTFQLTSSFKEDYYV